MLLLGEFRRRMSRGKACDSLHQTVEIVTAAWREELYLLDVDVCRYTFGVKATAVDCSIATIVTAVGSEGNVVMLSFRLVGSLWDVEVWLILIMQHRSVKGRERE
mmetsp:Transcript_17729/g.23467  ORF Transcript_17729/g.23467 Transcript_17729/m.23467 type:complete len:105 (+) Transcript_17729:409-723(+)